ncbi:Pleckstrin-likey domain-containing protein 1 [Vitis vinifera]|uniref:Pleckstrin-likey domain-containing protein 1 n=1 Tax=Vitis vinifera TaxID=29760 RepID=A0A438HA34_VITVI|nr:Pleckstrin-likey domain-containing protein 1 [Vitis vinifera]
MTRTTTAAWSSGQTLSARAGSPNKASTSRPGVAAGSSSSRQALLVQGIHHHPRLQAACVIPVASCLTVKGAEDVLNKQFAFELSTRTETMYFIADSEKEKEDWINSIGRSIVQHSRSVTDSEIVDYDSKR